MVHLPLWSFPCSAYKTNSPNLSFLTQPSIAMTAWLPIHNRIIFKIALMTYRTLATSNPPYLQHLLFRRHTSGLRSSSTIQLHQPVHKPSLINRGFSHASPAVWNALPPQVRDQPFLELFKCHLKTHLFRTPTWSYWRHMRLWRYANGAL